MRHSPASPTSQLRAALRLLVGATVLAGLLVMVLVLTHLRDATLEAATRQAEASARLLEEHAHRLFRGTNFILGQVAELGRSRPMAELAASEANWRRLTAMTEGLPEPGSLEIVDAAGAVVLTTRAFPALPANVADRHHFTAHRDGGTDLHIGPLVQVKNYEDSVFHISRRIQGRDGRFLGAAVAGIEAGLFTDFYANLSLGSHATMVIVDDEGRIVLRQPHSANWVDRKLRGSLLLERAKVAGSGSYRAPSPFDGVDRLVAFRLLPEFGVIVACTVAVDDALAGWWRTVVVALAFAGGFAALMAWLSAVTFSSLAREEATLEGLEETVRQRTDEANQRMEEARRANDSKTRFLAAASHDLRQPLQAAGMFVEVLAARVDDPGVNPVVDKLRQSVEATNALLTTLLDVSTLEAGCIKPNVATFALNPLLSGLANQMEHESAARDVTLKVVPCTRRVISDPVLLERLLRNLVLNALRYTPAGTVLLGCRRRGDHMAIQVVDTGIGIPPDKLEAIFEDFTRLDPPAGKRAMSPGLGLGLAVVRRMAALLDHTVIVRSDPGCGSCFTVLVPLAPVELRQNL